MKTLEEQVNEILRKMQVNDAVKERERNKHFVCLAGIDKEERDGCGNSS